MKRFSVRRNAEGAQSGNAAVPASSRDYVAEFSVDHLFGRYSYDTIPLYTGERELPRLTFLYGENGTGKTTLLNLLFNVLSYREGRGHKTALCGTKFKRISVRLLSGKGVIVTKNDDSLIGGMTFNFDGDVIPLVPEKNGVIRKSPEIEEIHRRLSCFCLDYILVPDHRILESTLDLTREEEEPAAARPFNKLFLQRVDWDHAPRQESPKDVLEGLQNRLLREIIETTRDRLRGSAIKAGTSGDEGAAKIYIDVATALTSNRKPKVLATRDKASLLSYVEDLEASIRPFIKYGLTDFRLKEIMKIVGGASEGQIDNLSLAIGPYLDFVSGRLAAISQVMLAMRNLETTLNKFLTRKSVSISLFEGVTILDSAGNPLDVQGLSSGERHLIVLFFSTLLSNDNDSLIMVDEPELSLDFRWQRKLVDALIDLSEARKTQFLMATHAVEMMAEYKSSVQVLEPRA